MTDAAPADPGRPADRAAEAHALAERVTAPWFWRRSNGGGSRPLSGAEIESALFVELGLRDESARVWRESRAVSDRAHRRVGALLRARYGIRSPRGGLVTVLVLVCVLGMVAPLVLLGIGYRGHALEPDPRTGALLTAIVGTVMLAASMLTLGRPVARPTFFQSGVVCVLLGGFALLWILASGADPSTRTWLAVGAIGLVLAVIVFWFGRIRDPESTARIDAALETVRAEVLVEVEHERQRLFAELEQVFAVRGDRELLRRARTIALAALHAGGNDADDTQPDSVPGAYIVVERTSDWLPKRWPPSSRHRGDVTR
ncbi:hypothetical protein FLP10_11550 [Agromyces intestinalis]|uniref:Uncharacterized protein n=1 Tax=Agromyces intestinalis TaxID=2592652 RepID=A0A5C1YH91_9MICO|nr:hypothetical protein [Agromyces intestinalis]QEO14978.1 hypothetical protein FLP10_11550 [Agromyces intestinalis]